jgi:DedD protein
VDILLKQRLVGAVVIISLAVIFLPMLFTGKGELGTVEFESSIPPEPVYEIQAPSLSDNEAPAPAKVLKPVPLSEPVAQKAAAADPEQNKPKPNKSASQEGSNTAQTAERETAEKAAQAASQQNTHLKQPAPPKPKKPSGQQSPAPPESPQDSAPKSTAPKVVEQTDPDVTGWVVQVGSFSKQNNATALRNRLREKGMSSFVVKAQTGKGLVYRVRVGPELERSGAEELQKKILQQTQLKGFVARYP